MSHNLAEDTDTIPIGFITVSKLLCSQLEQMYREMKGIDNATLRSCVFISLSDLLGELSRSTGIGWSINDREETCRSFHVGANLRLGSRRSFTISFTGTSSTIYS